MNLIKNSHCRVSSWLLPILLMVVPLAPLGAQTPLPKGYSECATGDNSGGNWETPIYGKRIELSELPSDLSSGAPLSTFGAYHYGNSYSDSEPEIVGAVRFELPDGTAYLVEVRDDRWGTRVNMFAEWCGTPNPNWKYRECRRTWWDAEDATLGTESRNLYIVKKSFLPGQAELVFFRYDKMLFSDSEGCAYRSLILGREGTPVSHDLIKSMEVAN